ncbi:MAG: phospholipid/cholesterol/gamma-HCH transport system substrate-binding protein [Maribacter sp.]|jgi:phospholipid/cholesterol/gamma-HCH transport system substrate-binding protein
MSKKNIVYLISGIILLILIVVGYYYIKEHEILSNNNTYKVKFENVTGLGPSADVMYRGFKIGKVKKISFNEGDALVIAELKISKDYSFPKDAVIAMCTGGLMDGNFLSLEYDKSCKGADCAQDGQFLKVRTAGGLENMLGKNPLATEFGVEDDDVSKLMDVWKEKVINPGSDHLIGKSLADMDAITKRMETLEKDADAMSKKSMRKYERIMQNVEKLEKLLEDDRVKIVMDDLDELSKMMDNLDMDKPMKHADRTMKSVEKLQADADKEMAAMNKSMDEAKEILDEMETLKGNMKSDNGSIKYFLDKDGVAKDIEVTMGAVDQLMNNYENKTYLYKFFLSRKKHIRQQAKKEKKRLEEEAKKAEGVGE